MSRKTENRLVAGLAGEVLGIWAEKEDGSRRQLAGPFKNLILDSGLDGYLNSPGECYLPGYIYVSTDTSTPIASGSGPSSPTSIGGIDGTAANTQAAVTIGSDTYTKVRKVTYATSSIGGATGTWASLLLRVAKSYGNNAYQPNFNLAWSLIKDGSGNPTTVTVLSTERLVVQWAIDFYVKETVTTQTTTVLGVTTNIAWRPYNLDDTNAWFWRGYNTRALEQSQLNNGSTPVSITGLPSGTNLRTSSGSGASYTPGSFTRAFNFSASTGSSGTINSILVQGMVNYQGILDVPISIIGANTFTWQLSLTLARATDLGIT